MDDEKRQDLEILRQQIDPRILARVASAMGEDPSAAAALSGLGSSNRTSQQRRTSARLSGLKPRKSRKRTIKPARNEPLPSPIHHVAFAVYDPTHFRAKQLGAFIQRMGFRHVTVSSNPEQFMRMLLSYLNDPLIERTSLAIYDEYYPGMKALLASKPVQQMRSILPKFDQLATFVMVESDQPPETINGLDPRYTLTMRLTPEFIGKRVRRLLDLPE